MTLYNFGYLAATDKSAPPADNAFKTFDPYYPSNYPVVQNYGNPVYAGDGTIIYTGKAKITLQFAGLLFNRRPDGDTSSIVGTTQEFMQEWRYAQDNCKQQMWVNMWDVISGQWVKRLATVLRPHFNVKGIHVENLEIELTALDLDTATYQGGAVTVPNPSTLGGINGYNLPTGTVVTPAPPWTTSATGDQFEGTWGAGKWGVGYWGHAGYAPSGIQNKFSRSYGQATASGTLESNGIDFSTKYPFGASATATGTINVS